jgi:hypothetical protein
VIGLDCGFLLTVAPWGIPNKVANHNKVWKRRAPFHPWVLKRVSFDEGRLLFGHCLAQSTTKTLVGAKGEVEENNIPRGIEVMARFQFDSESPFLFPLTCHL